MDLGVLDKMDTPRLKEYLRWLLWHFRVMDGFWFLSVEQKYDRKAAEDLDEMVWGKIAGMSSKDLVQRFGIREKGIDGLVKAMEMCPWTMIVGYHITREGNDAYITVPTCPTQVARVRHGLPEFHCRDMHQTEFESFAHGVDPAIKVECLLSPPDHPPDLFCKWRFYLDD
jgi:hypothetical protein